MSGLPKPGRRIRLLAMPDDPAPIPVGATGIVTEVVEFEEPIAALGNMTAQVWVAWEEPHAQRTLSLSVPHDQWEYDEYDIDVVDCPRCSAIIEGSSVTIDDSEIDPVDNVALVYWIAPCPKCWIDVRGQIKEALP